MDKGINSGPSSWRDARRWGETTSQCSDGGQSKLISYFFLECSTYYFLIAVDHGNWNHRRWKDCALLCYIFNRYLSSDQVLGCGLRFLYYPNFHAFGYNLENNSHLRAITNPSSLWRTIIFVKLSLNPNKVLSIVPIKHLSSFVNHLSTCMNLTASVMVLMSRRQWPRFPFCVFHALSRY